VIDLSPYQLIIFDKDGTLIDFDAMWGGWVEALAAQLEALTGARLAPALFQAMGYDPAARRTLAGGPLAVRSMASLRILTGEVLVAQGLSAGEAESALAAAWQVPNPSLTARPLADLPRLFSALREAGLKIAVATSDDHAPTIATMATLKVDHLVDFVIGADDGLPLKPRPDMVWAACQVTGVEPRLTIVVGDGLADLEMGLAAGAGLTVGVTTGVTDASALAPCADVIMSSVADLMA
jgi:phosphoglycolate phosphatase